MSYFDRVLETAAKRKPADFVWFKYNADRGLSIPFGPGRKEAIRKGDRFGALEIERGKHRDTMRIVLERLGLEEETYLSLDAGDKLLDRARKIKTPTRLAEPETPAPAPAPKPRTPKPKPEAPTPKPTPPAKPRAPRGDHGLTANEAAVLLSIYTNEYISGPLEDGGSVWSNTIDHSDYPSGVAGTALPGVVSSLSKKGLATASGGRSADAVVELTKAGLKIGAQLLAAKKAESKTPAPQPSLEDHYKGLAGWVEDYKKMRGINPREAKKIRDNIERKIKEHGLDPKRVWGEDPDDPARRYPPETPTPEAPPTRKLSGKQVTEMWPGLDWSVTQHRDGMITYMAALWRYYNVEKFDSKMTLPNLRLLREQKSTKMRVRGHWTKSTRTIAISPRVFNNQVKFNEVFLHEMCLTGDTLVSTNKGLVRMDAITDVGATEVLTKHGVAQIEKHWSTGVKPTVCVRTSLGSELNLTGNHPVLVLQPNCKLKWTRTDALKIGDYVVHRLGGVGKGTSDLTYALKAVENLGHRVKPTDKFPKAMTSSLARILGYLGSEGSFLGTSQSVVEFYNTDPELVADYVACWERCFGFTPNICPEGRRVTVQRKDVGAWLTTIGFVPGYAYEKDVPAAILQASAKHKREYLRAYVEGDGDIGRKYSITTSSPRMVQHLKLLLAELGVISTVRTGQPSAYNYAKRPYYRVKLLDGAVSTRMFPPISSRRRHKYAAAVAYYTNRRQFQLGKHWKVPFVGDYARKRVKSANIRWLTKGFGYPEQVVQVLTQTIRPQQARRLRRLLGQFVFDRVTSLAAGPTTTVWDLQTSKAQFVANGIVVHNCHQAVSEITKLTYREPRGGHGPVWEGWMRKVGLTPSRYDTDGNEVYMDEDELRAKRMRDDHMAKMTEGLHKIAPNYNTAAQYYDPEKKTWHRGVIVQPSDKQQKRWVFVSGYDAKNPVTRTWTNVPSGWFYTIPKPDVYDYQGPLWKDAATTVARQIREQQANRKLMRDVRRGGWGGLLNNPRSD